MSATMAAAGATVTPDGDALPDCADRVLCCSSADAPGAASIPAQEAVVAVVKATFAATPPAAEDGHATSPAARPCVRFLVFKQQIGSVLGHGGATITSIRATSRATIKVQDDGLPACGKPGSEEMVTVTGDETTVTLAVQSITGQLRASQVSGTTTSFIGPNGGVAGAAAAAAAPPGVGGGGMPRMGGMQPMTMGQRPPMAAAGGAAAGGTSERLTVDNTHVGSIVGKGGSNINQIRSASGAHVKLHEQTAGSNVRLIEITGAPDRVEAAKAMIQAFMAGDANGMAFVQSGGAGAGAGAAMGGMGGNNMGMAGGMHGMFGGGGGGGYGMLQQQGGYGMQQQGGYGMQQQQQQHQAAWAAYYAQQQQQSRQ
jgi:predicted RNA-binding protein YlqC (UPF0109 family)